jgi:hypothetical protein
MLLAHVVMQRRSWVNERQILNTAVFSTGSHTAKQGLGRETSRAVSTERLQDLEDWRMKGGGKDGGEYLWAENYPCQYIGRRTQYDNVFISYTCKPITQEPVSPEMRRSCVTLRASKRGYNAAYTCTRSENDIQHSNGAIVRADRDIVTPLCVFSRQGRCQGYV